MIAHGRRSLLFVLGWAAALSGCAHSTSTPNPALADYTLRLIGRHTLDHRLQFGGTTVGGLSGIDYDARTDRWVVISDDRSEYAPTRFYTARLTFVGDRFVDAALQTVVTFVLRDGTPYPLDAADAEAIRFDPSTGTLWWSSEGGRGADDGDPFVRESDAEGRPVGSLPVDPMFRFTDDGRGPRRNRAFEGLALTADGRSLFVAMEGSLLQDGPMPTMQHGAWSRISRHDRAGAASFGAMRAQYAYPLDPIPSAGAWTAALALNGISEILASDNERLLVLERAFTIGGGWHVRLYEADWRGATDIGARASLVATTPFEPMTKRLVFDFDTLPFDPDNLEGMSFGPTLANGHRTLVLVSDDNFNPGETTQLLAFEIVPR